MTTIIHCSRWLAHCIRSPYISVCSTAVWLCRTRVLKISIYFTQPRLYTGRCNILHPCKKLSRYQPASFVVVVFVVVGGDSESVREAYNLPIKFKMTTGSPQGVDRKPNNNNWDLLGSPYRVKVLNSNDDHERAQPPSQKPIRAGHCYRLIKMSILPKLPPFLGSSVGCWYGDGGR